MMLLTTDRIAPIYVVRKFATAIYFSKIGKCSLMLIYAIAEYLQRPPYRSQGVVLNVPGVLVRTNCNVSAKHEHMLQRVYSPEYN